MDWIGVGLSGDVPAKTVLPSNIEGAELAVWCSTSGVYHAWMDRCPHRGMRLSHGFVRGESLACIYHGWQYDQDGRCNHIPAHPALNPPKTICTTSFDCVERDGVIWVALDGSDQDPPSADGRQAIRSLGINRSARDVARETGHALSPIIPLDDEHDLALVLQPVDDGSCVVHALAGQGINPKMVSRGLEKMRRQWEAGKV